MTKADEGSAKEPGFKDTKCSVKIGDIQKLERKNSINITAFLLLKQSKIFNPCVKKML